MATILALQVHVLRQRKWAILRSFAPQDRSTAWNLYVSLGHATGYEGKKFVEETVRDNGLMVANTVSLQIFDPHPERQDGPAEGRTPGRRLPRQRPYGGVADRLFGFLKAYGQKPRGRDENAFRRTKTAAFAPVGYPDRIRRFNHAVNPRSDAYTTRYTDEGELSVTELVRAESTEVLGTAFFGFVHDNLVTDALRDDPRFRIGIGCFVVGALVRIENELDLDSDRGKALLTDVLWIFLLDAAAVESFVARMATILGQPASTRFIKAGARCFEQFETGDLDGLADRFRATFEREVLDRSALADGQETAIFVVRIADPVLLREEYGNVGIQTAVDHMARALGELEVEHGGRTLKALGDSLMCAARRPEAMVAIAIGLLRGYKRGPAWQAVPPHDICIGGDFGGAVLKDGDFFGTTVQMAASLAAFAAAGEACFPAGLEPVVLQSGAKQIRRSKLATDGGRNGFAVLHVQ